MRSSLALGGTAVRAPRGLARARVMPGAARPHRVASVRPAGRLGPVRAYAGHVDVQFTLQRKVLFGQSVLLTGSAEELGCWDLGRAARLEWSEGRNGEHHWSTTLSLPVGAELEFKYVIEDKNHEPLWESCWNRKLTVGPRGAELYAYWDAPAEEEAAPADSSDSGSLSTDSFTSDAYADGLSYAGAATTNGAVNGKVKLSAAAEAAVGDIIAAAEASGAAAGRALAAVAAAGGGPKVNGWHGRGRSPTRLNGTGLSPEQRAFLERKAAEARGASATPSSLRLDGAVGAPTALSPDQAAFLERKRREASSSPPPPARARSSTPPRGRTSSPAPGGLSAEQRAFLERKQREASASPGPSRGRSPARASPTAAGLSPEQQAFLARKRAESASPAPAPSRGRSPAPARGRSPAPAPISSAAPSANGLSPEQQAFLERKRAESRSPAPARGRAATAPVSSAAAPRGLSPEQQAFMQRKQQGGSAAPAPAASRPAPAAAVGLSPEQQAFLARKRAESASPAPAPSRGRSPAPARGRSAAPAPARSAAPSANGLSPEQQAFLERKRAESRSPSPARGHSPVPTGGRPAHDSSAPFGLSPEQQAFMERKRAESRSPAPVNGRSRSPVAAGVGARAPAGLSAEQLAFLQRSGKL